jgi:hypothetical protein
MTAQCAWNGESFQYVESKGLEEWFSADDGGRTRSASSIVDDHGPLLSLPIPTHGVVIVLHVGQASLPH